MKTTGNPIPAGPAVSGKLSSLQATCFPCDQEYPGHAFQPAAPAIDR